MVKINKRLHVNGEYIGEIDLVRQSISGFCKKNNLCKSIKDIESVSSSHATRSIYVTVKSP